MFSLNLLIELFTFLVSIIFWKYIRGTKLKTLPFFLFFVCAVEMTGRYFRNIGSNEANLTLFNFSIPLEYLYYFYLFYLHGQPILKRTAKIIAGIFLALAIFFLFYSPLSKLHSYVLVGGELGVVICVCIYLFEKFTSDEDESLSRDYFFWMASGMFLFNLVDMVYFAFYPIIKRNGLDEFRQLFKAVNNNLSLLLYTSYIVAILMFRKMHKNAPRL